MRAILDIVIIVLDLYVWLLIASAILSWLIAFNVVNTRNQFVAAVAEPCHCGAAICRGLIVDDNPANLAELPDHLRALLRGPVRVAS